MLNQVILVGRIVEIEEIDNHTEITISIPRTYRNISGQYDDDFISCVVSQNMIHKVEEYCELGNLVGIKGKIAKLEEDKEMRIIAEKMTFLSNRKTEEGEE